MFTRALPCPDCGCESPCVICESPNESTPTITVSAAIDGVTNVSCGGNTCDDNYGGTTHVWDMDLLVDDEEFCYGGSYQPGNVCTGAGSTGSDLRLTATISKPDEFGEAILTVAQTNTDLGAFTATATLTIPFDCESFGPITMSLTIDGPGTLPRCDATALTLDVSLSI
jgi:hypothetical protein